MEKLQPKLRFSEFEGSWNKKKLNDINVSVIDGDRGSNYPNGNDFSKDGYCLFLNAKNVTKNGFSFSERTFINKEKDEKLRKGKLNRNDIILTTRGSVGHISYYDNKIKYDNIRINSGMVIIRTDFKFINSDYLYKYFNSNQIQNEINIVAFGSAQPQLTVNEILKFKICYPSIEEQTKIANFLSSVDEKLNLLKEKKALLEDYKKGIMQKIFNQEIRFKDDNGNDFEDWETINLIDILKENKTRNKNNEITEVFSVAKSKGVINQIEHLGRSYASDNISNYKVVFENDIIYTKSPTSDFPYGIVKQNKLNRKGVVSVLYGIFTPINKYVGNLLENYFSDWKNTYNYLDPIIQKGAKNTINIGNETFLNGEKLLFPMDINEQIKISNFLIAMDNKIELVSSQIQDTQEYKKGLLQQMFV